MIIQIKNELKQNFISSLIWSLSIVLLLLLFLPLYNSFYDNKESLILAFKTMPEELLEAFGVNIETLFTPTGYYSFIYEYILICSSIFASILGLNITFKDKMNCNLEFLFTKPMKRKNILIIKTLSVFIIILLFNILYYIMSFILFNIFLSSDLSTKEFFLMNISLLFIQLTFASISLMISSFIKNPKSTNNTALLIIGCFYLLTITGDVLNLSFLRYVNPFAYFDVCDILLHGHLKISFVLTTILIIIFCLNLSTSRYDNQDI